jgi:electron transfer flavoprotein beta subunit
MNVLACVKRVPAPGARIVLTDDGRAIDTRHLGFTVSPHEECAVEEAVRIVEAHGGRSTVLTLGPEAADDQLRTAISMGIDDGVRVPSDEPEPDPRATAHAITAAIRELEQDGGTFDVILFGNESADAGNYQVGIRVATALGRSVVAGVKHLELTDGTVRAHRAVADGVEVCTLGLPAVVAVKEGINLPRYPAMRGRLLAKKATIRHVEVPLPPSALTSERFHHPPQQEAETRILGQGADAAEAIVELFEEVGLL